MSSHREAPEISKDPVADSTDTYAFVSPDRPDTVTIITNYIPLEDPAGGPNFFEFGDDVLYRINVDNDGDGKADITYDFNFKTVVNNPDTFLYNTGPIGSLDSPNFNRRQFFTVSEDRKGKKTKTLGKNLASPPCNIGLRSTPGYSDLANSAIYSLDDGIMVFAGQRLDGFYVDLGSVFDLAALRPFQNLHLISTPAAPGHRRPAQLQRAHDRDPDPDQPADAQGQGADRSVGSRHRDRRVGVGVPPEGPLPRREPQLVVGPVPQVSRLGNPLFNEVIVPMGRKDRWNALPPHRDSEFAQYVAQPELAKLLPVLYPGVFPNLATLTDVDRADLLAILLTGIPAGLIPGFQNFTGPTQADMLRLNVAIPPTAPRRNLNGILGGDLAGFPNGRRVFDNIVTDRAAGGRRGDLPARRRDVRARRRGVVDQRRRVAARQRQLPRRVPVPRPPGQRLRRPAAVGVRSR